MVEELFDGDAASSAVIAADFPLAGIDDGDLAIVASQLEALDED